MHKTYALSTEYPKKYLYQSLTRTAQKVQLNKPCQLFINSVGAVNCSVLLGFQWETSENIFSFSHYPKLPAAYTKITLLLHDSLSICKERSKRHQKTDMGKKQKICITIPLARSLPVSHISSSQKWPAWLLPLRNCWYLLGKHMPFSCC